MRCSQSLAAYSGRDFVTPKDVRALLKLVIGHRLRLKLRSRSEWKSVDHVLDSILDSIKLKNEDPS